MGSALVSATRRGWSGEPTICREREKSGQGEGWWAAGWRWWGWLPAAICLWELVPVICFWLWERFRALFITESVSGYFPIGNAVCLSPPAEIPMWRYHCLSFSHHSNWKWHSYSFLFCFCPKLRVILLSAFKVIACCTYKCISLTVYFMQKKNAKTFGKNLGG